MGFGLANRIRRSGQRWMVGWVIGMGLSASTNVAQAVPVQLLTSGSTVAGDAPALGLDIGGSVFVRARHRTIGDADPVTSLGLTRARLGIELHYGPFLKLKVSPDLERDGYLADAYFEARPLDGLKVRIGQQKVPFGQLEWRSRWDIPTINRGVVTEQIARRLGFSNRRVGGLVEGRVKAWPGKPSLELGVFDNGDLNDRYDLSARLTVKPKKGLDVAAAYYRREEAKTAGGAGDAGQLSVEYQRHHVWALAEVLLGRARRLTADAVPAGLDATFFGVRGIGAYDFDLEVVRIQPYLGGELLDPGVRTTSDLGWSLRGGATVFFWERLRVSLEAEHTDGPAAFVLPKSTTFALFLGARVG